MEERRYDRWSWSWRLNNGGRARAKRKVPIPARAYISTPYFRNPIFCFCFCLLFLLSCFSGAFLGGVFGFDWVLAMVMNKVWMHILILPYGNCPEILSMAEIEGKESEYEAGMQCVLYIYIFSEEGLYRERDSFSSCFSLFLFVSCLSTLLYVLSHFVPSSRLISLWRG